MVEIKDTLFDEEGHLVCPRCHARSAIDRPAPRMSSIVRLLAAAALTVGIVAVMILGLFLHAIVAR